MTASEMRRAQTMRERWRSMFATVSSITVTNSAAIAARLRWGKRAPIRSASLSMVERR